MTLLPPEPSPIVPDFPTTVLQAIAAAEPELWFVAESPQRSRELDEVVWQLRRTGLIIVGDWVKGRGQGLKLTALGRTTLAVETIRPARPDLPPPASGAVAAMNSEPRPTVVTPAILALALAWFAMGLLLALGNEGRRGGGREYLAGSAPAALVRAGAVDGESLLAGEWWRLVTAPLTHAGLGALVISLVSLITLGPVAELLWGRRRFAGIVTVAAVAGVTASLAVTPDTPSCGLSGAVWGVIAALAVWLTRYRTNIPDAVVAAWIRRATVVAAANAIAFAAPGGDPPAAAAGVVAGFAGALLLDWTRAGESRRRTTAGLVGLLGVATLAVGALVATTYTSSAWRALRAAHLPRVALARWCQPQGPSHLCREHPPVGPPTPGNRTGKACAPSANALCSCVGGRNEANPASLSQFAQTGRRFARPGAPGTQDAHAPCHRRATPIWEGIELAERLISYTPDSTPDDTTGVECWVATDCEPRAGELARPTVGS